MPGRFCLCSGVDLGLFLLGWVASKNLTFSLWLGWKEAETTSNNRILNCLTLALSVYPKAGQSSWKINLEASSATSEEERMFLGIQRMGPAVAACRQLRRWPSPYLLRVGLTINSRRASQNQLPEVWLWMLLYLHIIYDFLCFLPSQWGFPGWFNAKESSCQCRRCTFNPGVSKIPWGRKWQSTPVCLSGKSHRQRTLAGYTVHEIPESDTT